MTKEYYQSHKKRHIERVRQWRASNKDKVHKYQRTYYEANREKILRKCKESWPEKYKSDPEKYKSRALAWYNLNRKRPRKPRSKMSHEEVLQRKRTYRSKNKARYAALCRKRQALKRSVTVGDLTEIAKVYDRARWWRQWFDVVVDHIRPLSKEGTHEAKNLQVIYRSENQKKFNSLNYKPKVVFGCAL